MAKGFYKPGEEEQERSDRDRRDDQHNDYEQASPRPDAREGRDRPSGDDRFERREPPQRDERREYRPEGDRRRDDQAPGKIGRGYGKAAPNPDHIQGRSDERSGGDRPGRPFTPRAEQNYGRGGSADNQDRNWDSPRDRRDEPGYRSNNWESRDNRTPYQEERPPRRPFNEHMRRDDRSNYQDDGRGGYQDDRRGGDREDRRGDYRDDRRDDHQDDRRSGQQDDRRGGYQDDRRGGYQDDRRGGYQDDRRGGYQDDRRGGYQDDRRGGFQDDRRGGYQDDRRSGYQDARRSGYQDARRSGYDDARQSGYQDDRRGAHQDDRREGYQGREYGKNVGRGYGNANRQNEDRGPQSRSQEWKRMVRDDGPADSRRAAPSYPREDKRRFKPPTPPNLDPSSLQEPIRLNKFVARCTRYSRKEADDLVKRGRVTVNGEIVGPGVMIKPGDIVLFDEKPLTRRDHLVYILINKPRGVEASLEEKNVKSNEDSATWEDSDEQEKDGTLASVLKFEGAEQLQVVNALEAVMMGLQLVSNDPNLAVHFTQHPPKETFTLSLTEPLDQEKLDSLPRIDGGNKPGIVLAEFLSEDHTKLSIVVRGDFPAKQLKTAGIEFERVDRLHFAGLTKKDLPRGHWRFLSDREVTWITMFQQ